MYCYLQVNLRKFRVLLFLPFAVSYILFGLSLNHNHYNNSYYDRNDPRHCLVRNCLIKAEQVVKINQPEKSTASNSPSANSLLLETIFCVTELNRLVARHGHLMSILVIAYSPPAFFHNRASPI